MLTRKRRSEFDTRKILFRNIFEKEEKFKQEFYEVYQFNTKSFPKHIQYLIILSKSRKIVEKVLQNKDILEDTVLFLKRNKSEFSNFVSKQLNKIKNINDTQTSEIITGIITGLMVDSILHKIDI